MEITREIENISQYFEGEPEEGWEFRGIKKEERCYAYYYQDRQGGWHHRTVKRKAEYNPFEMQIREENGIWYAKIINKKSGKPIRV